MLGPLLLMVGMVAGVSPGQEGKPYYQPYQQASLDLVYNLLFCDDPALFRPKAGDAKGVLGVVASESPSVDELARVAADESVESRLRALAYHRLRQADASVPKGRLLGVIVEYPLERGLDVLGVFADGRVRYINQTGKLAVFEKLPADLAAKQKILMKASGAAIRAMGPWDGPRLAPPAAGLVRLTFLVSDGLYFGEGPPAAIGSDDIGGPVLTAATQLVLAIVDARAKPPATP